jgi:predicted Zn-dependent peptidase
MLNRLEAPAIKDAIDFDLQLKPYTKYTLDNGVEVYAIDAGEEEVIQAEWVLFAGNWYEEQNLVAATANHLLKNGTSTKTAFQVNEHFEYYGAYLNRACYSETATINLHTLSKHLPQLLPVVQELITDSVFPEEELQIYKQNNRQRLEVSLKKSDFVAGRLIDEYVYGLQHPYGKYSTFEAYDALGRESLQAFYKQYYQQGKCIIFVAGKLPKDIVEQLNKNFGTLPLNKAVIPGKQYIATPSAQKKYRISNDPDGVQGSIRMARHFPNRHHPDFTKTMVLNTIFGGFFGSRLMDNIREDKGYTYGIHSYLQNHIHESAWVVSTEAGRDVCEATLTEVYKEMKTLREELVEEDELLLVKNYMLGSVLGDLDGPFHIIGRWKTIILNQLPETFFYDSVRSIKTVTAEELMALANKYLQPEAFYELVVV